MQFLTKNNTGTGYELSNMSALKYSGLKLEIYDDHIIAVDPHNPGEDLEILFPSILVLKTIFALIKNEPHKIVTNNPMQSFTRYLQQVKLFKSLYNECNFDERTDLMSGVLGQKY